MNRIQKIVAIGVSLCALLCPDIALADPTFTIFVGGGIVAVQTVVWFVQPNRRLVERDDELLHALCPVQRAEYVAHPTNGNLAPISSRKLTVFNGDSLMNYCHTSGPIPGLSILDRLGVEMLCPYSLTRKIVAFVGAAFAIRNTNGNEIALTNSDSDATLAIEFVSREGLPTYQASTTWTPSVGYPGEHGCRYENVTRSVTARTACL